MHHISLPHLPHVHVSSFTLVLSTHIFHLFHMCSVPTILISLICATCLICDMCVSYTCIFSPMCAACPYKCREV
jgi:hypothetical protein